MVLPSSCLPHVVRGGGDVDAEAREGVVEVGGQALVDIGTGLPVRDLVTCRQQQHRTQVMLFPI